MGKRLKIHAITSEQLNEAGITGEVADDLLIDSKHSATLCNYCGAAGIWAVNEVASLRNELRIAKRK